jgi:hypothetical protein
MKREDRGLSSTSQRNTCRRNAVAGNDGTMGEDRWRVIVPVLRRGVPLVPVVQPTDAGQRDDLGLSVRVPLYRELRRT